jgi:hypothetical protein
VDVTLSTCVGVVAVKEEVDPVRSVNTDACDGGTDVDDVDDEIDEIDAPGDGIELADDEIVVGTEVDVRSS